MNDGPIVGGACRQHEHQSSMQATAREPAEIEIARAPGDGHASLGRRILV
jgi:hypothetical protein